MLTSLVVAFRTLNENILKTAKDDGCARATLHVQAGSQPFCSVYRRGPIIVH